jgi:hypothetical protein
MTITGWKAESLTSRNGRPPNPLQVLGEFLIQKSKEIEGDAKKESE